MTTTEPLDLPPLMRRSKLTISTIKLRVAASRSHTDVAVYTLAPFADRYVVPCRLVAAKFPRQVFFPADSPAQSLPSPSCRSVVSFWCFSLHHLFFKCDAVISSSVPVSLLAATLSHLRFPDTILRANPNAS